MDKFLIAENPMREGAGMWIIHLLNPQAHIQCIEGHIETDKVHKYYRYKNSDGVNEKWTLSAQFFFTTDFLTEPEQQVIPLLDRAWYWFMAYMQFEDNNIDNNEASKDN